MGTFAIDRVGLILTLCNDIDLIPGFYRSLVDSMPSGYSYGLMAVDGGSYDGSVEAMKTCEVRGPFADLSRALNEGIRAYLPTSKDVLIRKYGEMPNKVDAFDYIGWIHPDMKFPVEGWLPKMVAYLKAHPEIGKLAPELSQFKDHPDLGDREGNQCPWVMPTHVLRKIEKDHKWFDENFKGIGGMEDWDLNKRVMEAGYKVSIVHSIYVEHQGMGTRAKKDTNLDAIHNRRYFESKWGNANCPV